MIMLFMVTSMFLYVMFKLIYNNLFEENSSKMDPENKPTKIRRDSTLAADLEEFQLKHLHRFIVTCLTPTLKVSLNIYYIFVPFEFWRAFFCCFSSGVLGSQ